MSKTASKSMHNWRRYPSSNWYEIDQKRGSKFGALLRRHLTPEKNRMYVHNYSPSCIQMLKKVFGKFTSGRTFGFGAHKLVHSEPFLDYPYEIWHLMSALYSDMRKKNYIGAHLYTFSALNYCGGILFKYLSYLYEVVRTNFSADFWTFRNFWPPFRENCGAKTKMRTSASERSIHSEKALKTASKSTYKPSHNCLNYVPHAQTDQAWHTKNTNLRYYSRRA